MRERGESQTEWERVRAKTEEQLARDIASDPDWADIPRDWMKDAIAVMPGPKQLLSLRLDQDVVQWFRDQGPGYQTRINAVLRAFVQDQTKRRA
ncbi:BrnA antitoxin family protein [Acidisoma cellulosilytica]|uniref:BrnA antitoxin family protein n=2 Tax=Acidisoma cellulosilyticum TaxID=2802395 RepID=A0A963YYP3_9PROT|nr:BrnA antitoxin family protein [Acidisoma cellulosilyticum]